MQSGADELTLSSAISGFLDSPEARTTLSQSSLSAYRGDLQRFNEFCRGIGVTAAADVTRTVMEDYAGWMASAQGAGLAPSTTARRVAAVRRFSRWAAERGFLGSDPTIGVHVEASHSRPSTALTVAQVKQLLDAPGQDALGMRDRALVALLYDTGARVSELVVADLVDLPGSLSAATAPLLRVGRSGASRSVALTTSVVPVQEYVERARPVLIAGRDEAALLVNARGHRLSRQGAWALLQQVAHNAEVEAAVTADSLRHARASHLLADGVDEREVQRRLGHVSVATTRAHGGRVVRPDPAPDSSTALPRY